MKLNARTLVIHAAALAAFVWTIVPLVWLLDIALMYHREFDAYPTHLYPHVPTLSNFERLLGLTAHGINGAVLNPIGYGPLIVAGVVNSVLVAVGVTVASLLVTVPTAYALGRLNMRHRAAGLLAIVATRALPPIATTIPFYAVYTQLHLAGTQVGLGIAHLTITVPLLVWVGSSFFASLPQGLERVARVDGCSRLQALYRVVIPAAAPALTAMAVIAFLTSWDEFTFALILTTGTTAQTFPAALSSMFFQISVPTEVAAATILGLIPPLVVAAVFQRYIRQVNLVTVY